MKTVVIGGVYRTDKSTLANKIFQNTKATVFHAHRTRFLMISYCQKNIIVGCVMARQII